MTHLLNWLFHLLGPKSLLLSIFLAMATIVSLDLASGETLHAVTLLYFRGTGQNDAVKLEWATATELSTAGFQIERATQKAGPFQLLDEIGFVPSEAPPDGLTGAEYLEVDRDGIVNGKTYWYVLIEIEIDGTENRTEPISVIAGQATPDDFEQPTQSPNANSTLPAQKQNATSTAIPSPTLDSRSVEPTVTAEQSALDDDVFTSSPRSVGTRVPPSNDNIVEANEFLDSPAIQTTPGVGEYPGPLQPTPVFSDDFGNESTSPYPVLAPDTIEQPIAPYPDQNSADFLTAYPGSQRGISPSISGSGFQDVPGIGEVSEPPGISETSPGSAGDSLLGTFTLWVGFIAALVLFITSVYGSIQLYSRQRLNK